MLSFNKKENTQVTYTDNYVTIFSMFFFFFFFQTTLQTDEIKNVPCGTRCD